ncbi:MAG TPA: hypothetical protein VJA21_20365 [Verrucomicrobiae bacterium]
MNDVETQQRFVLLRAQGLGFARIADELKVSKPTRIKSKCRSGPRENPLTRKTHYSTLTLRRRSLDRYTARMLFGVRRPRKPSELAVVCQLLKVYLKFRRRNAKEDPENWDWAAVGRASREQDWQRYYMREIEPAFRRVYGQPPGNSGPHSLRHPPLPP